MSIEQKLKELEALAEQLQQIEEGTSKDSEKDDEELEDEPEGEDTAIEPDETEGKDDSEEESCGDKEKNESVEEIVEEEITEETIETPVSLEVIFEGTDYSDEFKSKLKEVFESAVQREADARVDEIKSALVEEALNETVSNEEFLAEKVDGYLDYIVEQWVEKNSLAIDRGIKTTILESFVEGLKGLFESHYIDVPDEKFDLVEAVQTEKAELVEEKDELIEEIVALRKELRDSKKAIAISEAVADMVATDADKFKTLIEDVPFTTQEEFGQKLAQIRQTFFESTVVEKKSSVDEIMSDAPVEVLDESAKQPQLSPEMKAYLATFNRH